MHASISVGRNKIRINYGDEFSGESICVIFSATSENNSHCIGWNSDIVLRTKTNSIEYEEEVT